MVETEKEKRKKKNMDILNWHFLKFKYLIAKMMKDQIL
jgi:hypothetical protein